MPVISKALKEWIHADTLLVGVCLALGGFAAGYCSARTVLTHNNIVLRKTFAFPFFTEHNHKLVENPVLAEKKKEMLVDRYDILNKQ